MYALDGNRLATLKGLQQGNRHKYTPGVSSRRQAALSRIHRRKGISQEDIDLLGRLTTPQDCVQSSVGSPRGELFVHWCYIPRKKDVLSKCEIFHLNMLRHFNVLNRVEVIHVRCATKDGKCTKAIQRAISVLSQGTATLDFKVVIQNSRWEHDTFKECVEYSVSTGKFVYYTHFKGISRMHDSNLCMKHQRRVRYSTDLDILYWNYLMYEALFTAPEDALAVGPLRHTGINDSYKHKDISWSRLGGCREPFHYCGSYQAFSGEYIRDCLNGCNLQTTAIRDSVLWVGDPYTVEMFLSLVTLEKDVYTLGAPEGHKNFRAYAMYADKCFPVHYNRFRGLYMWQSMKVIVGITSWSKRISTAALTLESILNQTVKADSVELNLDLENFPNGLNDLPPEILKLLDTHDNFHVYFESKDYRVWLKSVPTIRRHTGEDYVLFTLDDDCTYYPTYIEESLHHFGQYPGCAAMNTSTTGIAGEYMVYRSSFLNKCLPYLTNDFISQVRVDDCCWFWFFRKFGVKQAPAVPTAICKDRMQGYSYRRVFSDTLPDGVADVEDWTKMDGEYPMAVLQKELVVIQKHLKVH